MIPTFSNVNKIVTFSCSTPWGLGTIEQAITRVLSLAFCNLFLKKEKKKHLLQQKGCVHEIRFPVRLLVLHYALFYHLELF